MPFASVRLRAGVDRERTFTLNEGGYSKTQLCRFKDGLLQALGGWVKWLSTALVSPPRAILSWIDLNGAVLTAFGTDSHIYVKTDTALLDLMPGYSTTNPPVAVSTTSGSTTVTVTDPGASAAAGLVVVIETPIAVGGLILEGSYTVTGAAPQGFTIAASTSATSTVVSGGAVASYTSSAGSIAVTVTLPGHGQSAGSQWAQPIPVTLGNLTISGSYLVASVQSSSQFTIYASAVATISTTVASNGGNARIQYYSAASAATPSYSYGVGGYGLGPYGIGSAYTPPPAISAPLWTLAHWGETLLACPGSGPIFSYTPNLGQQALQLVPGAPTVNGGIFVAMPAQILVTWGSSISGVVQPNLVQWSDQLDYTSWTATVTNQAGNFTIPTGSKIMGAVQAPNQAYIFTDVDVYTMTYIGATNIELVFGFLQVAQECGLVAARAVGVLNSRVYWLSPGQFLTIAPGTGVSPIPCPVWDEIFQDLDTSNIEKVFCATNSQFNEVSWFFPSKSGGTGECDSYVKFNEVENAWDYGKLARSAWQDYSPAGSPLAGATTGDVYQHEVGTTADGEPLNWSFASGAFMISEGDQMMFVDWMLPDFRYGMINDASTDAAVSVVVNSYRFAGDTPVPSPPLVCSTAGPGALSLRIRGRALQITASGSGFFRMGNLRYRMAPDGKYG